MDDAPHETGNSSPFRAADWRAAAAIAARQDGMLRRDDLARASFDDDAVKHAVRTGKLHRRHRGVYALGNPRLTRRQELRAALLFAGPAAGLSDETALEHWRLGPPTGVLHLVTPTHRRSPPGLRIHHRPRAATTHHEGLSVTTLAQTVLDVAGRRSDVQVAHLVAQIEQRSRRHIAELQRLADAAGRRHGAPRVRRVLAQRTPARGRTRSDLEIAFGLLVARRRLPPPERNVLVRLDDGEVAELDAVWWTARLAVELDGGEAHGTALAFHADRRRDRRVAAETGLRTIRVTWTDVEDRPDELVADLRALLHAAV